MAPMRKHKLRLLRQIPGWRGSDLRGVTEDGRMSCVDFVTAWGMPDFVAPSIIPRLTLSGTKPVTVPKIIGLFITSRVAYICLFTLPRVIIASLQAHSFTKMLLLLRQKISNTVQCLSEARGMFLNTNPVFKNSLKAVNCPGPPAKKEILDSSYS